MRTTQIPFNRWVDKGNVVHRHHQTHSVIKKEESSVICDQMAESERHANAKWEKPGRDKYCNLTYMRNLKNNNDNNQRHRNRDLNELDVVARGCGGRDMADTGHMCAFSVVRSSWGLRCSVVTIINNTVFYN